MGAASAAVAVGGTLHLAADRDANQKRPSSLSPSPSSSSLYCPPASAAAWLPAGQRAAWRSRAAARGRGGLGRRQLGVVQWAKEGGGGGGSEKGEGGDKGKEEERERGGEEEVAERESDGEQGVIAGGDKEASRISVENASSSSIGSVEKLEEGDERSWRLLREERSVRRRREERQRRALQRAMSGRSSVFGSGAVSDLVFSLRDAMDDLFGIQRDINEAQLTKLNIQKLRSCFSYTDFWPTGSRTYGNGAIFQGNLRGSVQEVRPKLEEKLSAAAGDPVTVFFLLDDVSNQQVCMVQRTEEMALKLRSQRAAGFTRWPLAALLASTSLLTTANIGGVNLDPYGVGSGGQHAVLLVGGLGGVLLVGELFQRIMAKRYNLPLSPPYFIPGPIGCLGSAVRLEGLAASSTALFDLAAARAVGSFTAALMLAAAALLSDGGVMGGSDPIYVEPSFFEPNFVVAFVQYIIGPYSDDLGNVFPNAVEGVGVPVNPLAFAALLGMVVTALNLLPAGQLEGGRIVQALFGRKAARSTSFVTAMALAVGGIFGSVLCLTWAFITLFFRNGEELPSLDEVSPVDKWRVLLAWLLLSTSILLLLPNSGGTFPSFIPPVPSL